MPAARALASVPDHRIEDLERKIDILQTYVDKTLHVLCKYVEDQAVRRERPYYPLDDGWALTSLDTGHLFFVNTHDRNVAPWIILGGHWERNVDRVMTTYVKPGMTVLDVGSHFGYYAVKLGALIGPKGRLLAFEPNPEVNAVCLENIKINGLASSVSLHKHALGDFDGRATLTRSESNMASANLVGEEDADYSVTVAVRRLDDVVPSDLRPDLIKLDAEGYEKRILDGAAETLRRSPGCSLMIELGLEKWERNAPLADLIPACGGGKDLYAVHADGMLERFEIGRLRDFLLGCSFHENYFLVGPRERVEAQCGALIRR